MRDIRLYVDGSYQEEKIGPYILGIVGYGAVIVDDGIVTRTFRGYTTDPKYTVHHNPAGELLSVLKTLRGLPLYPDSTITIYHDYKGIAEWALGRWKRNIELTKQYKKEMDVYIPKFNIKFKKVKALHKKKSNKYTIHNTYNDMADDLANRAIAEFINTHGEIDLDNLEIHECDTGEF